MNYYNEFDPKAAAWLRQLIADGLIPPGRVDERSICDVQPGDLDGFIQCHFFAGMVPAGDPSIQEVKATAESRVARLRGYGNSIVPQVAAEFIKAFREVI